MTATIGFLAIALGTASAALGVANIAIGLLRGRPTQIRSGRRLVFVVLGFAIVAVAAMEWALITHDFSIEYVANNNARATPLLFTVTGLWASLEGSILLWALILSGYLAFTAYRFRARATDPMVAWATLVGLVVALFFFALMLGPANPFAVGSTVPLDGAGPNPLLQNHPLMAFHPPMLYLGYIGFTIPFSFAIASLVTGRADEGWLADTRRTTLMAWGFLTAGIILGAWWSYEVLGWGGFWAWDPVENASLLPWLTATAFIHSLMVQARRGMLRVWNLSLVIATFCLTILGTFLTRSGVLNSVHAFSDSDIGPWLLIFLGFIAGGSIALIAWRADALRAPGRIDSAVSLEAAFLGNNLLFAALAFVVLLGTVFPLLAEALRGQQLSVGEPYFDTMATPIGLAILFLMAAAPALPWRATSGEVLGRRLMVPAWIGGLTMVAAVALGTRSLAAVAAFGLCSFAIAGVARSVSVGVRARHRAYDEGWIRAAIRTVTSNPRLYGGLVVHVGVVLIAVALASFSTFGTRREVRLERGESVEVSGYTVTFLGTDLERTAQKTTKSARLRLERGGDVLGVYEPSISTFPNVSTGIGTPSVRTGILEDVYLTLVSSPSQSDRVTIGVAINPMVLWLWIGGGVMAAGTVVALLPVRERDARSRVRSAQTPTEAGEESSAPPPDPADRSGRSEPSEPADAPA